MLQDDTGFLNTRESMVLPNDPFKTTLILVDGFGSPVNLTGLDIRWRIVPLGTGMRMSTTLLGVSGATPDSNPLTITVLNMAGGSIRLSSIGDVLNDPRGYDYVVETKPTTSDVVEYTAVARGHIHVFNQPRAL